MYQLSTCVRCEALEIEIEVEHVGALNGASPSGALAKLFPEEIGPPVAEAPLIPCDDRMPPSTICIRWRPPESSPSLNRARQSR